MFLSLEQEHGLANFDMSCKCQLEKYGDNGGFQEDTKVKHKLVASYGNYKDLHLHQ